MFPESFLTMGCSQVFKKVNINDTNFDKLIICQNGLRKPHFVSRLSPSDQFSQNYDTCSKTITWWRGAATQSTIFQMVDRLEQLQLSDQPVQSADNRNGTLSSLQTLMVSRYEALQMMYVKIRYKLVFNARKLSWKGFTNILSVKTVMQSWKAHF